MTGILYMEYIHMFRGWELQRSNGADSNAAREREGGPWG